MMVLRLTQCECMHSRCRRGRCICVVKKVHTSGRQHAAEHTSLVISRKAGTSTVLNMCRDSGTWYPRPISMQIQILYTQIQIQMQMQILHTQHTDTDADTEADTAHTDTDADTVHTDTDADTDADTVHTAHRCRYRCRYCTHSTQMQMQIQILYTQHTAHRYRYRYCTQSTQIQMQIQIQILHTQHTDADADTDTAHTHTAHRYKCRYRYRYCTHRYRCRCRYRCCTHTRTHARTQAWQNYCVGGNEPPPGSGGAPLQTGRRQAVSFVLFSLFDK